MASSTTTTSTTTQSNSSLSKNAQQPEVWPGGAILGADLTSGANTTTQNLQTQITNLTETINIITQNINNPPASGAYSFLPRRIAISDFGVNIAQGQNRPLVKLADGQYVACWNSRTDSGPNTNTWKIIKSAPPYNTWTGLDGNLSPTVLNLPSQGYVNMPLIAQHPATGEIAIVCNNGLSASLPSLSNTYYYASSGSGNYAYSRTESMDKCSVGLRSLSDCLIPGSGSAYLLFASNNAVNDFGGFGDISSINVLIQKSPAPTWKTTGFNGVVVSGSPITNVGGYNYSAFDNARVVQIDSLTYLFGCGFTNSTLTPGNVGFSLSSDGGVTWSGLYSPGNYRCYTTTLFKANLSDSTLQRFSGSLGTAGAWAMAAITGTTRVAIVYVSSSSLGQKAGLFYCEYDTTKGISARASHVMLSEFSAEVCPVVTANDGYVRVLWLHQTSSGVSYSLQCRSVLQGNAMSPASWTSRKSFPLVGYGNNLYEQTFQFGAAQGGVDIINGQNTIPLIFCTNLQSSVSTSAYNASLDTAFIPTASLDAP